MEHPFDPPPPEWAPDGRSMLDRPATAADHERWASIPRPDDVWRPGDHARQTWDDAAGGWAYVPVDPDTGEPAAGPRGRYSLALGAAYDPDAEPELARWAGLVESPAPTGTGSRVTEPVGSPSLDTGATSRHWDRPRDRERLAANDRAKATLVPLIHDAAAGHRAGDRCDCAERDERAELVHAHGCPIAERGWLHARAVALGGCREVRAYRDAVCGAYTAHPTSCRVRLCPDCERARSARMVARLAELTLDMARPVFWTFTVPNIRRGVLARGVDWLLEAFRALRRRAIFRGGPCRGCGGEHRPVAGGVYSIEVTRGRDGATWHPHVHALMDSPWMLQGEVRDAWRAVTCDAIRKLESGAGQRGRKVGEGSRPKRLPRCAHRADDKGRPLDGCRGASIVWVEAVKGEPGTPERRHALAEVLKYTTGGLVKDGKLAAGITPADLAELLLSLRNRRLVAGWGDWRHVQDDDPEDELPEDETVLVDTGARTPHGLTIYQRMPARCPHCLGTALWDLPVVVPRAACTPGPAGILGWRPPRAGP